MNFIWVSRTQNNWNKLIADGWFLFLYLQWGAARRSRRGFHRTRWCDHPPMDTELAQTSNKTSCRKKMLGQFPIEDANLTLLTINKPNPVLPPVSCWMPSIINHYPHGLKWYWHQRHQPISCDELVPLEPESLRWNVTCVSAIWYFHVRRHSSHLWSTRGRPPHLIVSVSLTHTCTHLSGLRPMETHFQSCILCDHILRGIYVWVIAALCEFRTCDIIQY